MSLFEKELTVFYSIQNNLKKENPFGGYVVIFNNETLGIWKERSEALQNGLQKYGNAPFLVKSIFEEQRTINYTNKIQSI
ncbi:MAG: hypothetical protein ACO3EE_04555 [Flavobacteriales bacterium]